MSCNVADFEKPGLPDILALIPGLPSASFPSSIPIPDPTGLGGMPDFEKPGLPDILALIPGLPSAAFPFALPAPPCALD